MAALLERGSYIFWIPINKILVLKVATFYPMIIYWLSIVGHFHLSVRNPAKKWGWESSGKTVSSMFLSGRTTPCILGVTLL